MKHVPIIHCYLKKIMSNYIYKGNAKIFGIGADDMPLTGYLKLKFLHHR